MMSMKVHKVGASDQEHPEHLKYQAALVFYWVFNFANT